MRSVDRVSRSLLRKPTTLFSPLLVNPRVPVVNRSYFTSGPWVSRMKTTKLLPSIERPLYLYKPMQWPVQRLGIRQMSSAVGNNESKEPRNGAEEFSMAIEKLCNNKHFPKLTWVLTSATDFIDLFVQPTTYLNPLIKFAIITLWFNIFMSIVYMFMLVIFLIIEVIVKI